MRSYSTAALNALSNGDAMAAGAVRIGATTPLMIWGGFGTISLGGEFYTGIGDQGLITATGGALGDAAQNLTLTLSGIDPDVAPLFFASGVKRAPVVIWRMIFNGAGTALLDAQVYARGRLDTLESKETVGGLSTIIAEVETAARGLGRSGQRMRSDADQRLIDASDGGFKNTSYAGVRTLYWGGKRPQAAGVAVGGGGIATPAYQNEYRQN